MIIFKKAVPSEFQHAKDAFFHNSFMHFRASQFAVFKNDWNFFYFKTKFPGSKFHFYLKCITEKMDFIEVDTFQHFLLITHEACGSIFNGNPGYKPGIQ